MRCPSTAQIGALPPPRRLFRERVGSLWRCDPMHLHDADCVVADLLSSFDFVVCHRPGRVRRLAPRRCQFRQREAAWTYASRLVRTPSIYTLIQSLLETHTTLFGAQESVGGPQWGGNRTSVEEAMLASGGDPRTYTGSGTEPCRITLRKWCVTPCALCHPTSAVKLGAVLRSHTLAFGTTCITLGILG